MRTAQLHLQRSSEALLGYLQGIACDDQLTNAEIANLQNVTSVIIHCAKA